MHPRPPAPAHDAVRIRRWHVITLAAVILAAPALAGLVVWASPAVTFTAGAADVLGKAPAVRIAFGHTDDSGRETTGVLTVTADGYASGTIADADSGTAALAATPDGTAVHGDEIWWMRRAPAQAGQLRDRWVRPSAGAGLPLDVAALRPSALGDLVGELTEKGEITDAGETFHGEAALTVTSGDWRLLLTESLPRRVLWLGGPVDAGALRPSVGIVPAGLRGEEGTAGGGYLGMSPEPEKDDGAEKARADGSGAMSGGGPAPSGIPSPSGPPAGSGGPPPEQEALTPPKPEFKIDYIYENPCITRTCGWLATITNTGDAAGHIYVTMYDDGKTRGPYDLGVLEPDASVSTPEWTRQNKAIGTGGAVSGFFEATVYCTEVDGDREKFDDLEKKGVAPEDIRRVAGLSGDYRNDVFDAMSRMIAEGAAAAVAQKAAETAIVNGLLPQLRTLLDAGDRFSGLGHIADKLGKPTNDSALSGTVGEIQTAAETLGRPTRPTVSYEGTVTEKNKKGETAEKGSDLLVVDEAGKEAVQIKTITNTGLVAALNEAVLQLNGEKGADANGVVQDAPEGYLAVVRINIALGPKSDYWDFEQDEFEVVLWQELQKGTIKVCSRPDWRFDKLVVKNVAGVYEWTREEICG